MSPCGSSGNDSSESSSASASSDSSSQSSSVSDSESEEGEAAPSFEADGSTTSNKLFRDMPMFSRQGWAPVVGALLQSPVTLGCQLDETWVSS